MPGVIGRVGAKWVGSTELGRVLRWFGCKSGRCKLDSTATGADRRPEPSVRSLRHVGLFSAFSREGALSEVSWGSYLQFLRNRQ
eukprot:COSAG02_NODE_5140_length_4593_cov_2.863657_3_plen_84_part_00